MSVIQTNVAANNAYRNLTATNSALGKQIQKLSSGFRINRAGDDAAGLAIANKLRNDGKALSAAQRNASQANAMLSIADGGAQTISQILDRMKELATSAASDNMSSDQRTKLNDEFQALNDEIQRTVDTTKYNGISLLSGNGTGAMAATGGTYTDQGTDIVKVSVADTNKAGTYTISSDKDANGVVTLSDGTNTQKVLADDGAQTLNFDKLGVTIETGVGFKIGDGTAAASFDTKTIVTAAGAGNGAPLDFLIGASGQQTSNDKVSISLPAIAKLSASLTSKAGAQTAMTSVDNLLDTTNTFIGKLGAAQSRMDFATQNLASTIQNTAAAESTIRDADMAFEMTQFTKQQVLAQAGTAMLSQANQSSQNILSLLR